ncbi:VWA domain-containing protein [archaeon]|nr:VWA domain-containing protein [archaeon]
MEVFGYIIDLANPIGWYSFLSFIVLFLVYLLKPKPFEKVIPSLVFLEKKRKKQSVASFFKKFVKDWIIIFQILVLLLLCFSTLNLFTHVNMKVKSQEVVFVVDASASMNVKDSGKLRFDRAIDIAVSEVGVKNSVVIIKDTPQIAAKLVNGREAKSALRKIKSTQSTTNIWDAMLLASDISENKNSKIIVLSDFIDTNNKDILTAKDILTSKGHEVILNKIGDEADNIGIISYRIENQKLIMEIKNFGGELSSFSFDDTKYEIQPYSIVTIEAEISEGKNEIKINTDDDFDVDDKIYLFSPKEENPKILFITNSDKKSYIQKAVTSIKNIQVDYAQPPILSSLDYDIFIIDNVDTDKVLPANIEDITNKVKFGSSLIISNQETLHNMNFGDLLPLSITEVKDGNNPILNSEGMTDFSDINFGQSSKFINAELIGDNIAKIAEIPTGSPQITLNRYGDGTVLFYGIFDEENNFKLSLDYPLFWITVIEKLSKGQSSDLSNLKTGDTIFSENKIRSPNGEKYDSYVVADKVGFYEAGDKIWAVNLLNPDESDINPTNDRDSEFVKVSAKNKARVKLELLPFIIILAMIFMYIELFFIKRRGDL